MRPHSRLTSKQSKKFIDRQNNRVAITIGLTIVSVVVWIYCFSSLSYLNALTIQSVTVKNAGEDISGNLSALALNSLGGNYLGLFSKANVFLYPHSQVASVVENASPRIKSLTVSRDGLQGLVVNVITKTPTAVVCATLPEFSENGLTRDELNECYLADASGFIFDKASVLKLATTSVILSSTSIYPNLNHYYIPALADQATTTASIIGSYATSTTEFISLQEFCDGVRQAGMKPVAVLSKENGEYEMYVNDVVIYFNDLRPLSDQLLNLVSFWDKLMKDEGGSSNYEYIDVRYGSNVFYRKIK